MSLVTLYVMQILSNPLLIYTGLYAFRGYCLSDSHVGFSGG